MNPDLNPREVDPSEVFLYNESVPIPVTLEAVFVLPEDKPTNVLKLAVVAVFDEALPIETLYKPVVLLKPAALPI